jgi:hypothetical protein
MASSFFMASLLVVVILACDGQWRYTSGCGAMAAAENNKKYIKIK